MTTHPPTLSKPSAPSSGTDHDALPPGTRFGEFEILRVLGVGGFGIVYLAQDHSLEREVALKEYMPASLAARGAGRFGREVGLGLVALAAAHNVFAVLLCVSHYYA